MNARLNHHWQTIRRLTESRDDHARRLDALEELSQRGLESVRERWTRCPAGNLTQASLVHDVEALKDARDKMARKLAHMPGLVSDTIERRLHLHRQRGIDVWFDRLCGCAFVLGTLAVAWFAFYGVVMTVIHLGWIG